MTLQWTIVATVMYVELAATILLVLPFISPTRWHRFFKSRFLKSIGDMSDLYFKLFLGLLIILFFDAIREMRKYNNELSEFESDHHKVHLDTDLQAHMRLFRAQRNFYISGFSLFLWIVIRRLVVLISNLAITMADKEAAMKQAKSASATASQLLGGEKENDSNESKELQEENNRLNAEYKAALKQAEAVTKEYDRLMEEHSTLQKELEKATGSEPSKKED